MKTKHIILALLITCGISPLLADNQINHTTTNLQLFPKVVQAGSNFLFTWCDNRPTTDDCEFEIFSTATNSSLSNSGFSDHELSVPSGGRAGHRLHTEIVPSIKSEGSDTGAIISWIDHNEQDVYVTRVNHNGSKDNDFGMNYVHDAAFMTPPQMCSDGDGGAYFVWVKDSLADHPGTEYDTLFHILKARKITSSGGDGWNNPAIKDIVGPTTDPITLPRICAVDDTAAMVAWSQLVNNRKRIILRRITSTGTLRDTIHVATAGKYYGPSWNHWHGLNLTHSGNRTILVMKYCRSVRDDNHADPGARRIEFMVWEYNYVCVVRNSDDYVYPPDTLGYVEYDPYFSGNPFTDDPNPYCPIRREAYSCLGTPVVAPGPNGSAYIAWAEGSWNLATGTRNDESEVWVAEISDSGTWVVSPTKISNGGYLSNRAPQIISDGTNALVVWQNMTGDGTQSTLYKRKILSSGPTGSASSVTDNYAFSFNLIYAGSNNAVLVWNRRLFSDDFDIYAKKFSF